MSNLRNNRSILFILFTGLLAVMWVFGAACEQLDDGKCKRDSHCESMAKTNAEVWVCYKEPPEAHLGDCMRVQDARDAQTKYQAKLKKEVGEAQASK